MTRQRTKTQSNPTIPKTQATVNEKAVRVAYAEGTEKITAMLDQLGERLKTHRARFDGQLHAGRTDWGFVGDLGHVAVLLTEITEFLGKE